MSLASLGRDPFGKRVRLHLQSPHTLPASGLRSDSAPSVSPTEASSAQTSRSSVDQDSSAGANTVGSFRPTEEKYREGTRDAEPSVKVPSTGSNSSPTIESKPSAIPDVSPERNGSGLIARNALPPERAEHAHSAVAVGPIPAARRNRALLTTKPATAAASKSSQMPSPKHAHPAVAVGPFRSAPRNLAVLTAKSVTGPAPKPSLPTASPRRPHLAVVVRPRETAPENPASHPAKPEETEVTKPPVMGTERNQPAVAAGPKGAAPGNSASDSAKSAATAGLRWSHPHSSPRPMNPAVAEGSLGATPRHFTSPTAKLPTVAQPNPVPPANSKPPLPAVPDGPKDAAPGPASPTAKSPTAAQPNPPPAYVVSVPSKSSKPLKLVFPQKQIAFSSSLVITTQLSVLVPPELGLVAAQPTRLQAGKLVSYVLPRNPRPDRYRAEETVKVHATIGQQGLVTEIRPMSGPIFLLSSTMSVVRLWRYKPTLLDGAPIETHQDVTIIFKLPQ